MATEDQTPWLSLFQHLRVDSVDSFFAAACDLDDVFVDEADEEPAGAFVAVGEVGGDVGTFATGVLEEVVDDEVQLMIGVFV